MIKSLKAREILDSRNKPTCEAELETDKGVFKASVPSGASTGKYEAVVNPNAVENIERIIAPKIIGMEPNQEEIDKLMIDLDGTDNKSNLGANAILAVSIAVCRAGADGPLYEYISRMSGLKTNIPVPCFNIINGGAHAKNNLDIQEFMVIPQEKSFSSNLRAGIDIYNYLKTLLNTDMMGDEGGYSPLLSDTNRALDFLKQAIKDYPETKIGLDCAATQFFKDGKYVISGKELSGDELIDFYNNIINSYPILSIEDPLAEEDWDNWKKIKRLETIIIGDDLTVTNKARVEMAKNYITGVIIKLNQVGTVSETIECVKTAKKLGLKITVSHRSGETMDDFIADLAVGVGADFIKSGAPGPKERMVKYNRILEIENG